LKPEICINYLAGFQLKHRLKKNHERRKKRTFGKKLRVKRAGKGFNPGYEKAVTGGR
jgi:hypothetical protein